MILRDCKPIRNTAQYDSDQARTIKLDCDGFLEFYIIKSRWETVMNDVEVPCLVGERQVGPRILAETFDSHRLREQRNASLHTLAPEDGYQV